MNNLFPRVLFLCLRSFCYLVNSPYVSVCFIYLFTFVFIFVNILSVFVCFVYLFLFGFSFCD